MIDYKLQKFDDKYFIKIYIDIDEFKFSYYVNCDDRFINNLKDIQENLLEEALIFYQKNILKSYLNNPPKEKNIELVSNTNLKNTIVNANSQSQDLVSKIEKLIEELNFNFEDKIQLIAKYDTNATTINELNEQQSKELYKELKEISNI